MTRVTNRATPTSTEGNSVVCSHNSLRAETFRSLQTHRAVGLVTLSQSTGKLENKQQQQKQFFGASLLLLLCLFVTRAATEFSSIYAIEEVLERTLHGDCFACAYFASSFSFSFFFFLSCSVVADKP